MTVAGALKLAFLFTHIGSCNDAAYPPLILHGDLTGNLTAAIQVLKVKGLLISAYLKDRVCGGVDDHGACVDFFFAQLFNNLRAACAFVSNYALAAALLKLCDQFRRKSVICKGDKGFGCSDSHHFPVPGHSVLAVAGFCNAHVAAHRMLHACHISGRMQI